MSLFLATMVFYIEFRILSEMKYFAEPTYMLPLYNIELKGTKATLAHLGNIILGITALITALFCYRAFRQ